MNTPEFFGRILKNLIKDARVKRDLTPEQEQYVDIELENMVGIVEGSNCGYQTIPRPWKTPQGDVIRLKHAKKIPTNIKVLYHAAKIDHPFKYCNLINENEMKDAFTMIQAYCGYKDSVDIPLGEKVIYCASLGLVLTLFNSEWYIGAVPEELTPAQLKLIKHKLEV